MTTNNASNQLNLPSGLVAASVPISVQTASGSTSIIFSNLNSTLYRMYYVIMNRILPTTNGDNLGLQFGNGGAFDTGYDVLGNYVTDAPAGPSNQHVGGANLITVTVGGISNGSPDHSYYGLVNIWGINDGSNSPQAQYTGAWYNGSNRVQLQGQGRKGATDYAQVQFLMSSGNILSGTFALYGIPV